MADSSDTSDDDVAVCLNRTRHEPLRRLEAQLSTIKAKEIGSAGLKHFKVRAKQVQLDDNGSPSLKFGFFLPCQSNLPPVDDKLIGMSFFDFDTPIAPGRRVPKDIRYADCLLSYFLHYTSLCKRHVQAQDRGHRVYRDIVDYPFEMSLFNSSPEWQVVKLAHVDDNQSPHLLSVMIYDPRGQDGKLLLGELLALTRLTTERWETDESKHSKAPILMFSFMGPQHGRILQAYYDGHRLVVNYTQIYDFRTKNVVGLQLFARWFLSKPTGDTKASPSASLVVESSSAAAESSSSAVESDGNTSNDNN
ncbi:hypothetical protein F5884DRAFT_799094 [Xylogone sp. PMI_703]|nr:hypothetical protein F5884DRAFT_799094 [Xylogone sp. PMI_703]